MVNKRVKRISNAECLRNILKINEQWAKKHNGDELLSERVKVCIDEILTSTDDDDLINVKFNRMLKAKDLN